jgi:hypothetical protein
VRLCHTKSIQSVACRYWECTHERCVPSPRGGGSTETGHNRSLASEFHPLWNMLCNMTKIEGTSKRIVVAQLRRLDDLRWHLGNDVKNNSRKGEMEWKLLSSLRTWLLWVESVVIYHKNPGRKVQFMLQSVVSTDNKNDGWWGLQKRKGRSSVVILAASDLL